LISAHLSAIHAEHSHQTISPRRIYTPSREVKS